MLLVGGVQPTIAVQFEDRHMMLAEEMKRLDKFTKFHPSDFSGTPS